MTATRNPRYRLIAGLGLAAFGLLLGLYLGYGARDRALDYSARKARLVLAPAFSSGASGTAFQKTLGAWIKSSSAGAAYATLSGPDGRVLASAGAWSGWLDGWLSAAHARGWRAWAYRVLCAEGVRSGFDVQSVERAELRIGVPWWQVLVAAGPSLGLAIAVVLVGLGLALRAKSEFAAGLGAAKTRELARPLAGVAIRDLADRTQGFKARLLKRISSPDSPARSSDDFRPIARRVAEFEPPVPHADSPAFAEPEPEPEPQTELGASQAPRPAAGDRPVSSSDGCTTIAAPVFWFFPLWSGVAKKSLAGAFVTAAQPGLHDDGPRPSGAAKLADASSKADREDALAPRLVRRLAVLQANWRTLELPRLPLFVLVSPGLLDIDGAIETWSSALEGLEENAEDIVLCVDRVPEPIRDVLSVRWAVAESDADDSLCYRLIAASGESQTIRIPNLDAPAGDPGTSPLPAREFARLIARRELAPYY